MIVILFRVLLFAAVTILLYTVFQYLKSPKRHLDIAKESEQFYFVDEANNRKRKIEFVYKGCFFEGEKYLGTTEDSFEVVTIQVVAPHPMELNGIRREDLYFLEKEILIRYPFATIEWEYPINQLLLENK